MRTLALLTLSIGGLVLGVACGPNCQNTCDQVYVQCGIQKAGRTTDDLLDTCVQECEQAMRESGPLGDYNPEQRRASNLSIELENDQQAVAWMDCVWNHAPDGTPEQCDDLDPSTGFCAPI